MSHEEKENIEDLELKSVSNVTPKKKQVPGQDKIGLIAVILASVVIIGFFARPSGEVKKERQESVATATQSNTLRDNLRELEMLKLALSNKSQQKELHKEFYSDYKPYEAINKPQPLIKRKKHIDKEVLVRMNAPLGFYSRKDAVRKASTNPDGSVNATLIGKGKNSEFMNSAADIGQKEAGTMMFPSETVPAGDIIPATLETAINSELPGMVRAITTQNVYGLSGNNVLIPKGSTLVGQYSSDVSQGQSRVFVVWSRVLLSNGTKVSINSPGSDAMGRTGMGASHVDTHFLEKFGTSTLLSVLGAASANVGMGRQDQNNSISDYRQMIADNFRAASSDALSQNLSIPPTIHVHQGEKINVFVAHDLSFHHVLNT